MVASRRERLRYQGSLGGNACLSVSRVALRMPDNDLGSEDKICGTRQAELKTVLAA